MINYEILKCCIKFILHTDFGETCQRIYYIKRRKFKYSNKVFIWTNSYAVWYRGKQSLLYWWAPLTKNIYLATSSVGVIL